MDTAVCACKSVRSKPGSKMMYNLHWGTRPLSTRCSIAQRLFSSGPDWKWNKPSALSFMRGAAEETAGTQQNQTSHQHLQYFKNHYEFNQATKHIHTSSMWQVTGKNNWRSLPANIQTDWTWLTPALYPSSWSCRPSENLAFIRQHPYPTEETFRTKQQNGASDKEVDWP